MTPVDGCMVHVLFVGRRCQRNERHRLSLRTSGFSTVTTDDTTDVPRLLAALRPAVCVIDLCSLREHGWTLCEAIRTIPSLSQTAIILLVGTTRSGRGRIKDRAARFGGMLLGKPLTSNDLVDCVATFIGLRRARSR